ncbi:MAG: DnaJ domain-containing protein [Flavobacterium sp.]|nr:DnaJ domain-containing protein [Flavobacterium sp.]
MINKDFYGCLKVSRDATQENIKAAYKKLVKQYHSDLNPKDANADKNMQALNEAYEILGDSEKKAKYDEELKKKNATNINQQDINRAYNTKTKFNWQMAASIIFIIGIVTFLIFSSNKSKGQI